MHHIINKICSSVITLGFSCLAIRAGAQQPLPLDPMVRMGRLPNGFTYYIRHNEQPAKRVSMYLVNNVGSILESDDQQGLAHFMEHMNFNGTTHFPKNELVDYLQKAGLRFGADINAHTTFDETVFQLPLPSDKPEVVSNGLQIIRDWAQNATLDPEEIDKERGVVLEEKRMGKGVGQRLQQVYLPVFIDGSLYSKRSPIGVDSVLNNFKPETIRRFYHDWYRPDLQAIIVVGDIDVDAFEKAIRDKFSDLRNPEHERPRTVYTVPLTGANHFLALTDPEATGTNLQILIKHEGMPIKTDSDYLHQVEQRLFSQLLVLRLLRLSQQGDVPFFQALAGIQSYLGGLDVFSATMVARPGQLEQGVKALWAQLQMVVRFGFTQAELDRAKTDLLTGTKNALQEKDKTPSESYVGEYQANFLHGAGAPGIDWEYAFLIKALPRLTLASINALAAQYIRPSNRDILLVAPEKEKNSLPAESTVLGWMKEVENGALKPYKEETSMLPLLSKQPHGGKVVERKENEALGLIQLTLSNGLKVILKPTSFQHEQILYNGTSPGGTSVVSDEDYPSAAMAGSVVVSAGVGNFNSNELKNYLAGKQALAIPSIGERSQGISGMTAPKDVETLLQLIYAYFTEPGKDTAIFRGILEKSKESLAHQGNDPASVFRDTANAFLNGYNPRRTKMTAGMLDQVNVDKAYAFYKTCFSDASAFTFTFVGNIDTAAIIPLLEKYLGSLPSTHAHMVAKDLGVRVPEGNVTKFVYKGMEDKATVNLVLSGHFDYTLQNLIALNALKEMLQIRLIQRLREDESGVYSPSVRLSALKYPQPWFGFIINFTCSPANADKLVASVLDEVKQLRTVGPPQENIDKWRAADRNAREVQLATNNWWLSYLSGQIENGEPLTQMKKHAAFVDAVTVSGLREAAAQFLDGNNFIRLELRPDTKK